MSATGLIAELRSRKDDVRAGIVHGEREAANSGGVEQACSLSILQEVEDTLIPSVGERGGHCEVADDAVGFKVAGSVAENDFGVLICLPIGMKDGDIGGGSCESESERKHG
jgi:hypothetical protein